MAARQFPGGPALLLAFLALPVSGAAAGDPPVPLDSTTRDFDQTHLVLHVTPRIAEGVVDGETTVSFLSLADPLRTLRLHCEDTQVLSAKDGRGTPLEFWLVDGVLSLRLPEPLPRGAPGSVVVSYRSRPTQGMFFHAPTAESPSTPLEMYSQGEGTDNRRWFPCYDEPDDRFTLEVYASVAGDLKTVSNGVLAGSATREGGLREDHWKLERAIPSYLVSLIVGRFETSTAKCGEIPLEYNGPPGRGEEVRNGYEFTPSMMAFFNDYIGTPYPWPRYAQTTVWDFVYGGMENASATTMNMRLLHPKEARPSYSSDGLVAHELAHQWFGDLLTCRTWDHLWLNEGFATYFTDLYFENRDGPDEFALHRRGQNRSYMEHTKEPEKLALKPSPRGDVPLEMFGGKQYDRGAAVLHQLRIEVGDGPFRDGIRAYVKGNADRAVTSEDFRRSMEGACGRGLGWFFDQWVYGAGYPVLEVSWEVLPAPKEGAARTLRVTVEQVQREGGGQAAEFRILVPARVMAGSAAAAVRLDVRRRKQSFDVPLPSGDLQVVRVGEGGGVFARIRLKQDREAWGRALQLDTDVAGRLDAAEALAEWPDFAAPRLADALARDPCWAVRQECARGLGRVPAKEAADALLGAVADPDSRVRDAVAESLGGRDRATAVAALAKMALGDANPYVRSQAARALGRVHAEGAYDLLAGLLKVESHRETIRQGALDGLKELGDPRALDLARPLLRYDWPRGDNFGMREAALRVLLGLAPDAPESRAAVVTLLSDPFHRMRSTACETAGNYRVREAAERLKAMAASETFPGVKAAAKAALEKILAPPPTSKE
jgi:aminopeptidase N